MITPDEFKTIVIRGRADPVWWVEKVLGGSPWSAQCDILASIRDNKRTAVRSAHSCGKSWLAARAALWYLCCHPMSIVVTTAPTWRQVQKILWQELRRAHVGSIYPLGGRLLQTELHFDDGWYAFGFSADNADAAQGIHAKNMLIIVDEASGVEPEIWAALDSMIASGNTRLLSIGNPTRPDGEFFNECRAAGVTRFKISAFDTPNFTSNGITFEDIASGAWKGRIKSELPAPWLISPEWVAEKYKRWGPDSPLFRSRVLAEFPQSATDSLIPLHLIEAAINRSLERTSPHVLGVDVARFGGDKTVIAERWGPVVRIHSRWEKKDTMETAGLVYDALHGTGAASAKIDTIGVGSGVYDRLNEQKCAVEDANAAMRPVDAERFVNARAEWFWNLRERAEQGELDLDGDEDLASQLANIKFRISSNGRIQIESKDDMRKRGMPSPNEADAVAIAFASLDRSNEIYFA